ncbi:PAS domain S-box protein [Sphingomonas aracearum]|nr:PAS domain S-box protein [Sphingomonas aracearum]
MSLAPRPVFLAGPSDLARIIAERDWSQTPLGPIESWPAHRRTVVSLILQSQLPIVTLWGEPGIMLYNDAYAVFAGGRHPELLGSEVRSGWPEVADLNDHVIKTVFRRGETLSYKDQPLVLNRNGSPEPLWTDLDYSPILDEEGRPAGVIAIVVETTAKVRAEQRAAGERERLQRKFEQSPGFTATLHGPDHVIDFANISFQELFHRTELVGKPAREALPRLWERGLGTLLNRVFRSGEPFSARGMAVTLDEADGSDPRRAFLDFTCQPLREEDGQVSGIFVTGYDVSQLRRAQERLDLAQRAGGVGTFELYPDTRTLSVSLEFCRLWGLPETDEVRLDDLAAMLEPEDQPGLRSTSEDPGQVALGYIEYRIRRGDTGERRWIARSGERVVEADGSVRFAGVVYDITHAKRAEEQLQQLNSTLEARVAQRSADLDRMWRLTTDLMLVADFDGVIQALNPAWSTMLGWDEGELIGQVLLDMVHPDDRASTAREVGKLESGLTTLHFENRYRHKDGSYRWLSWTAVPDDRFLHAVGRDIESEKQAQAQLEAAQDALRQSQKMEAVGQLTGGIAHDFNNLLTVVTGNIDMATRALDAAQVEDARSRRALDNAMKGAERAATLTQRLLAFSRRQPLAPRAIDVDRLVAGMGDLLNRSLGETIGLEIVTAPGLWRVEADPNQLESAILNLAVNARDAMPNGGELVIETANAQLGDDYVAAQAEVAPGQYVVIAVTDTGEGMGRDTIGRVFEPFFTTKQVGKGTGLGLSMVYGFVKQSGGNVKVYSEEGRGTTVKIYLPRMLSDAAPEEETFVTPGLEVSARRETVLAVEDDDDVRAYTVECLRDLGYRVLEAYDGPSALRLLKRQEEPIDLLFTDVVMPGMSGSELAQAAREQQPGLRVLYTSGYTRNAIVHGGRLDPGVEMIAKPFAYAALAQKVRDVLDTGRTGRVLVIDAAEGARRETVEALHGAGYAVDEAATPVEGLSLLRSARGRYDAVVIGAEPAETVAGELRALHADLPLLLLLPDEARAIVAEPADRCTATLARPFTGRLLIEALAAILRGCAQE